MESDQMESRMVLRGVEAFGSGLSLMNDSFIRPRRHSLPMEALIIIKMRAERRLESIESSDFGVPLGINRYGSLPILVDFGSDVSAVEVLNKPLDDQMTERKAQLHKKRSGLSHTPPHLMPDDLIGPDMDPVGDHDDLASVKSGEFSDSSLSFKSDRSKDFFTHFNATSPSRMAEELAQRCKKIRSLVNLQTSHVRRAERKAAAAAAAAEAEAAAAAAAEAAAAEAAMRHKEMMAHKSVEAFGSGLSLMNDPFIRPQQHYLPRLGDFGSDVSAVEDMKKDSDNLARSETLV